MISTTALLSLAMQCAPLIHPDTISDIAKVESGFHPYAIAEIVPSKEGGSSVISHMPKSKDDALKIVEDIKNKKRRYSVGLMQITSTNFPGFNVTAEQMFNPCDNLMIAEKILLDCYKRGGTLPRALSCYYTGNFDTGQKPEKNFNDTSYTQRIGYVVPSTKMDKQEAQPAGKQRRPSIIYPPTVIRGSFPEPQLQLQQITTIYPDKVIRGNLSE